MSNHSGPYIKILAAFILLSLDSAALSQMKKKIHTGPECGISGYIEEPSSDCGEAVIETYVCESESVRRTQMSCPGSFKGGQTWVLSRSNPNSGSISQNSGIGKPIAGAHNIIDFVNRANFGVHDFPFGVGRKNLSY